MWAYGPRYYTDTTSVFFVLFLGPFSNQYGRKILMVAPLIGHVLATLIRIANYYAVTLPAEYILLSDIPLGLFGGMITFSMAVNKYSSYPQRLFLYNALTIFSVYFI